MQVTEHATLRFIKRVYELDTGKLRKQIGRAASAWKNAGDGTYPIMGGKCRAVIKDNTVVTILP